MAFRATGPPATATPAHPLNLAGYDELRFWVRSDQAADGSDPSPFLFDIGYVDQSDTGPEEHRWLVGIRRAGVWEERRIGIEDEARSSVIRFEMRCLVHAPVLVELDEPAAVHEQPIADVEDALIALLERRVDVGLTDVPLVRPAKRGDTELVVGMNRRFRPGNRIAVRTAEKTSDFDLVSVSHDEDGGRTALGVAASQVVQTALTTEARVSVVVPVVVHDTPSPATPTSTPDPAFVLRRLDQRADSQRTSTVAQRDSFRMEQGMLTCAVRGPAQALAMGWEVAVSGTDPSQTGAVRSALASRLLGRTSLAVIGADCPLTVIPPAASESPTNASSLVIRVGTRMEVERRRRHVLARRPMVLAGALDRPGGLGPSSRDDLEGTAPA